MAPRGGSPAVVSLPKVSFTKVQDDFSKQPRGVHDLQAKSYGYNDTSVEFQRPDHYIRYIEPLESDLAVQVEYDMDEQDQAWLDGVNAERKKDQVDKISYETFEIVMDRLEKEWFDLTKNIPKSDFALPSEDSTCAICDDSEGENTNAIVFCDGCNLAVHQDCYGVPYIPEGQWLCRKCTVFPESPVSCILCPNEGGAFKQTVHGDWVHLLCAIWVPETRVENEVFMEPVTGVDKISKQRWKLKCDVCGVREGACIQCNRVTCFLAFHATCARKERLLLPMKATQGLEPPPLTCYCKKHLPLEQADIRAAALAAEHRSTDDEEDHDERAGNQSPKSSKSARAYAKTYKPGPPLVPYIIVKRILQYIGKINVRQKDKFVLLVCKYWSLKREARRGAPLLKRLHLEPWTASSNSRTQSDEEKAMKLEFMKRLKDDLERVRVLTQTVRKREAQKLRQMEAIRDVLAQIIFPHEAPLRMAFEKIMSADRQDFFKNPVSKNDVPDYYDVIHDPMCWSTIDQKLDAHEYWDLQEFRDDVNLVLKNAMTYNAKSTTFYKAAERILNAATPILVDLDKLARKHPEISLPPPVEEDTEETPDNSPEATLGDLEPPMDLLRLLSEGDAIKDETNLILSSSPVSSLFNYEFPVFKPPPPPKPRKLSRAEQLEAKRRQRMAALDSAPGFRAPRTRHAKAQAAAFEAEAIGATPTEETFTFPIPIPGTSTHGETPETEDSTTKKTKGRKRTPSILPGQSEEIPLVEDVDNQESFKYFNGGWVLPPDRKRNNRPPVERKPLPQSRKRQKTERAKSHLSNSTSAMENETLRTSSVPPEEQHVEAPGEMEMGSGGYAIVPPHPGAESDTVPMDISESIRPSASEDAMDVEPQQEIHPPPARLPSFSPPPRIIIIEELDSPLTRREKNRRRKEERLRVVAERAALAQQAQALLEARKPEPAPAPVVVPVQQPAEQAQVAEDMEVEAVILGIPEGAPSELSSLSDLSDVEDDAAEEEEAVAVEQPVPVVPARGPGEIILGEGEVLEGGTLVWAKLKAWPWWPAVIYEPDDPDVPEHIFQQKDTYLKTGGGSLHLVRFYDKRKNWQWLELNKLLLLGENDDLDADMLAPNSKRQRWRHTSDRNGCRTAYREATDEMEREEDAPPESESSTT